MRFLISLTWLILIGCAQSIFPPENFDANHSAFQAQARITVLNVHQGDATLIQADNGSNILIDAGNSLDGGQALKETLNQKGIRHLEAVFISHYDADHYGGLVSLQDGADGIKDTEDDISMAHVFDRGASKAKSSGYLFHLFESQFNTLRQTLSPGDIFDYGGIRIACLMVNGVSADGETFPIDNENENAHGAVFLISYGAFKFLNMGDLPAGTSDETPDLEMKIASLSGRVDVLHVGHHGSLTSTSEEFLDAIAPVAAIISVGNGNDYHHPALPVLHRLIQADLSIYQTERGETAPTLNDVVVKEGDIWITLASEGHFEIL